MEACDEFELSPKVHVKDEALTPAARPEKLTDSVSGVGTHPFLLPATRVQPGDA